MPAIQLTEEFFHWLKQQQIAAGGSARAIFKIEAWLTWGLFISGQLQ